MDKQGSKDYPLMNVQEVAQRLNLAVTTVYKMVNQRRIPFVKIGGALKFNPTQVERWIQDQTVMPMPSKIG